MTEQQEDEQVYLVSWQIDISASSPEEAARKARAMQLNPSSIADVFSVTPHGADEGVSIDLSALDGRSID